MEKKLVKAEDIKGKFKVEYVGYSMVIGIIGGILLNMILAIFEALMPVYIYLIVGTVISVAFIYFYNRLLVRLTCEKIFKEKTMDEDQIPVLKKTIKDIFILVFLVLTLLKYLAFSLDGNYEISGHLFFALGIILNGIAFFAVYPKTDKIIKENL